VLTDIGVTPGKYVLATIHRQANTDDQAILARLLEALNSLGEPVVFPVHPRTSHHMQEFGLNAGPNLILTKPLGYLDMLHATGFERGVMVQTGLYGNDNRFILDSIKARPYTTLAIAGLIGFAYGALRPR